MTDVADYLRRGALTIVALLELHRAGDPVPAFLHESAEEIAEALLAMARRIDALEAQAQADTSPKH